MRRSKQRVREHLLALGWILAASMGFSLSAQAYIPPIPTVIRSLAKKHSGFKAIRVVSLVTAMDKDRALGTQFKEVMTLDYPTRTLKSAAFDMSGKEIFAVEKKLGLESKLASELLFEANPETLTQSLKGFGIPIPEAEPPAPAADPKTSSLNRVNGVPVWVFGEEGKNPQLWIEKDGFVALRLVYGKADPVSGVRFENYRYTREFPYPKLITTERFKAEMTEIQVNPDAKTLRGHATLSHSDLGQVSDSALRELVTNFYIVLR